MTGVLHLTIATPMKVIADVPDVRSLRAEDESGGFGILPGHADFLTVLPASVVRWRGGDGAVRFCALRAGLLSVRQGSTIAIACREGILGEDLLQLERDIAKLRADQADADRRMQVEQMRLHANAVRQIMRYLRPGRVGAMEHPPAMSGHAGRGPR